MGEIVIEPRYRGFPDLALGGYACGVLGASLGDAAEVTLRRSVPVGRPLSLERGGDGLLLLDDEGVLAEAREADLDLDVPAPVPLDSARAAATRFPATYLDTCFVCGRARGEGDGLRIFPGPVDGRGLVAAPWTPHPAFAVEDGAARPEVVWAALDCPGLWALVQTRPRDSSENGLTGRMRARLSRDVEAGRPHVVVGWHIESEGRREQVGAAVFTDAGELCAATLHTIVRSSWGVPLGLDRWSPGWAGPRSDRPPQRRPQRGLGPARGQAGSGS